MIEIQSWTMLLIAIAGDLVLYGIRFYALPILLPWFYPDSVIAYILFFGMSFLIFWIWTQYFGVRGNEWAVSDAVYFLVVTAYGVTKGNIYGIGTVLIQTPYAILTTMLAQPIIWCIIMTFLVSLFQSAALFVCMLKKR